MKADCSTYSDRVTRFLRDETGAVTVDWVVITAGTVGMAIWLFTVITEQHFRDAATKINTDIETAIER